MSQIITENMENYSIAGYTLYKFKTVHAVASTF